MRTKSVRAQFALLLVSFMWGLTFPLIRNAVQEINPYQFVFSRFGFATIAFGLFILLRKVALSKIIACTIPGLILGGIAWASYFTQTVGLGEISAGRAAFITGLNVMMVPLLAPLFRVGKPNRNDLFAAGLANIRTLSFDRPIFWRNHDWRYLGAGLRTDLCYLYFSPSGFPYKPTNMTTPA